MLPQLTIILRADNDFYSQMSEVTLPSYSSSPFESSRQLDRRGLPYLSESLHQLPAFMNCPRGPLTSFLNLINLQISMEN
jgi:hypothetical protein